jgi:hypothetical protein
MLGARKRAISSFFVPLVPWWSALLSNVPGSSGSEEDHHQGTKTPSNAIFGALSTPRRRERPTLLRDRRVSEVDPSCCGFHGKCGTPAGAPRSEGDLHARSRQLLGVIEKFHAKYGDDGVKLYSKLDVATRRALARGDVNSLWRSRRGKCPR